MSLEWTRFGSLPMDGRGLTMVLGVCTSSSTAGPVYSCNAFLEPCQQPRLRSWESGHLGHCPFPMMKDSSVRINFAQQARGGLEDLKGGYIAVIRPLDPPGRWSLAVFAIPLLPHSALLQFSSTSDHADIHHQYAGCCSHHKWCLGSLLQDTNCDWHFQQQHRIRLCRCRWRTCRHHRGHSSRSVVQQERAPSFAWTGSYRRYWCRGYRGMEQHPRSRRRAWTFDCSVHVQCGR